MTAADYLRSSPLFAQLREPDVDEIAKVAYLRDYPKNSLIFSARDSGDTFYVIMAGRVKSTLVAEDGRAALLSVLEPGDFLGEMALFADAPNTASAIALEACRLLVLRRDDLYRAVMSIPGMALGMLRSFTRRLQDADHKIGGLILLDVPGRVANLLLQLADRHDGQVIENPPTHQMMSQEVASTRETVSRVVSELASAGIISTTREAIILRDRAALEVAAGHLRRHLRSASPSRRVERRRQALTTP